MRTALLYISILALLSLSVGQPFQEVQSETSPFFFWMGAIGPDNYIQKLTGKEVTGKEDTGKDIAGKGTVGNETARKETAGKDMTGKEEPQKKTTKEKSTLTAMEGLDIIQKNYAANFEKEAGSGEEYYYKLPTAEYYLSYEGQGESDSEYLYHLYEYVMDDATLNTGHTYTYGWYTVNKYTGEITDYSP